MSVDIADIRQYIDNYMSAFSTYMEDQMVAFLRANDLVPGDMRVTVTSDITKTKFEYRIEVDDHSRSRKLLDALEQVYEHDLGENCSACRAMIRVAEKAIREYERGQMP